MSPFAVVASVMLTGLLVAVPAAAAGVAGVRIELPGKAEIDTAAGRRVEIRIRTHRPGTLSLDVLGPDGDLVRRLQLGRVAVGTHRASWDGRDARGQAVPDEAWCLRAVLREGAREVVDDPCATTGGEVVEGLSPKLSANGDIVYDLPRPARVLVRVGIKGGAMLRSLSVWQPRPAGRNLQRWSAGDDLAPDLRDPRLALLVSAFRLPDNVVLTTGQPALDYRQWRLAQGWSEQADPAPDERARPLVRKGVRLARQHYLPRYKNRDPRIEVKLLTRAGQPVVPGNPLPKEVRVSVDLHPDDRWLMREQLYEVGFFVDGDFVSEEENGYVPISWIWNTEQLATGKHRMTVNLTGFTGRVGARTLEVVK